MKRHFLSLSAFVLLALFGAVASSVDAAQSYRVNAGQSNVQVNEHGVCKKITNTGTKDVFIPTNAAAEWNGFLAHLPSGVTAGDCLKRTASTLSTGSHTCVVTKNGNARCWGRNDYGQANPYNGGDAVAVSVGTLHTCVLKSNGNVSCWGFGGILGGGGIISYNNSDAVDISTGLNYTCILKTNGNSSCYGSVGYGPPYNGGNAVATSGQDSGVCHLLSGGNAFCDKGSGTCPGYPGMCGAVYSGNHGIGIAANSGHSCVLLDNGHINCWGRNNFGEINDNSGGLATNIAVGDSSTCVRKNDGNVSCWGINSVGQSNSYFGGDAVFVTQSPRWNTCILKSNGNVDCFGLNNYGQSNDYNGGDVKLP